MTIRGGGNPNTAMAAMPLGERTRRLGALPVEAYHCFMVGVLWTQPITSVWRELLRTQAGSPRIISRAIPDRYSMPPSSRPSRTRALPGGAEKRAVLDRRCARRLWHLAVGAGESLAARSNKRKGPRKRRKKKRSCCGGPLTRKAPYKPYAWPWTANCV